MTPLLEWRNIRGQKISKVLAKICLLWVYWVHEPIYWSFPWSHMYNWIGILGSWNNTHTGTLACRVRAALTPTQMKVVNLNQYHILGVGEIGTTVRKELKDAEVVVSIISPFNSAVWSLEKRNRS